LMERIFKCALRTLPWKLTVAGLRNVNNNGFAMFSGKLTLFLRFI
jgi:hypothetical protein